MQTERAQTKQSTPIRRNKQLQHKIESWQQVRLKRPENLAKNFHFFLAVSLLVRQKRREMVCKKMQWMKSGFFFCESVFSLRFLCVQRMHFLQLVLGFLFVGQFQAYTNIGHNIDFDVTTSTYSSQFEYLPHKHQIDQKSCQTRALTTCCVLKQNGYIPCFILFTFFGFTSSFLYPSFGWCVCALFPLKKIPSKE